MGTLTVQGQVFRLNPCIELVDFIIKYDNLLEKALTDNFTEDYIIRYIVEPSFDSEYLFQIRETDNSYYEIEAVVFQENLWEQEVDFILDSFKIDVHKKDIDKTLAVKLDNLFSIFTSSINETYIVEGLDGITYRFKRKTKDEIICGEAWSPNEDSPLGKLVSICDDLTKYAEGKYINLTQLEERINELYDIMACVQTEETPYNSINYFE